MARDRKKSSSDDKKFIQKAIKKPGALRKSLKTKPGEKVNIGKAEEAADAPGKLGQRARFFLNVLRPAASKRKRKSSLLK